MWWLLGAAIWAMLFAVVLGLCRSARTGDRRMRDAFEEMLAEQRRKTYVLHQSNQKNRAA